MIHVLGVAEANVLMLALGYLLLPLLRFRERPLVDRLLLGYAVGLAATGVLAATLAIAFVPLDVPVFAGVVVAAAVARRRWAPRTAPVTVPRLDAISAVAIGISVALLARAAALYAIKPLSEYDGWVIWATRARALYSFSGPAAPVFTDPSYPELQHPLLLSALEATDAHFMGAWDGTAVHIQLLGIAIAFAGGAWALLRPYVWPPLLATVLAAVLAAPAVLDQLGTNYADIPVAMFIALGVAALALWIAVGEHELVVAAALFFAAGALTKNEGELFAACALVAAALTCGRPRRPLALSAGFVLLCDAPWRVWVAAHHLRVTDYSLGNAFDPGYLRDHWQRVGPAARELVTQIFFVHSWSFVMILALVGVAAAFVSRALRGGSFAVLWLLLSFSGLVVIYWISVNPVEGNLYNSSNRTVDTLLLGGAALVPVLVAPRRRMQ
jgi:hypothetical protein